MYSCFLVETVWYGHSIPHRPYSFTHTWCIRVGSRSVPSSLQPTQLTSQMPRMFVLFFPSLLITAMLLFSTTDVLFSTICTDVTIGFLCIMFVVHLAARGWNVMHVNSIIFSSPSVHMFNVSESMVCDDDAVMTTLRRFSWRLKWQTPSGVPELHGSLCIHLGGLWCGIENQCLAVTTPSMYALCILLRSGLFRCLCPEAFPILTVDSFTSTTDVTNRLLGIMYCCCVVHVGYDCSVMGANCMEVVTCSHWW